MDPPEKPWIIDPFELVDVSKLLDVIPESGIIHLDGPYAGNTLNTLTRFTIYYGILSSLFTNKPKVYLLNVSIIIMFFVIVYISNNMDSIVFQLKGLSEVSTKEINNSGVKSVPLTKEDESLNSWESKRNIRVEPYSTEMDSQKLFKSAEINNPFHNQLRYSQCNVPTVIEDLDAIGKRPLINSYFDESNKPSEESLFEFQLNISGETLNNFNKYNDDRKVMEKQKINNEFRQFYTLPEKGCINDQDTFVKTLYGDPDDLVFKQINIVK